MPPDWTVRRIGPDEWQRLRALRLSALADAPTAFGSTLAREEKFGDEVWQQRAADGAAGLTSVTVVAERGGRLVGMASGLSIEPSAQPSHGSLLVGMFVAHSTRRLGIGEALVESIKGWARARGDDRLQLWAVSSNRPALTLYRRCGFEATGATRPLAHTPGLIEAHMVAPVSGGPAPGR
ncbi:MAG TPA: GNAT family N-acetyltransferase [Hyphomicrobiaceae bacterium]|nr:GNAT family N-acetyltransferase [Hyphomicrobiaceae bacterium]